MSGKIERLKIDYQRAYRCWLSNNLKSCLLICNRLTKILSKAAIESGQSDQEEYVKLKHLVWFLKIRCLSEEYHVNESFLLNENDIKREGHVEVLGGSTNRGTAMSKGRPTTSGAKQARLMTGGTTLGSRYRTAGIITGRLTSATSRPGSRISSSYRPLTTSLTASQTAFSRSTKPLLKYSGCKFLSRIVYSYLYNAQTSNSQCPDYRQCIEYVNLIQNNRRNEAPVSETLEDASISREDWKSLDVFWIVSLGACYYNLGMYRRAEDYFKWALFKQPKYLDPYTWLIKVYVNTNQLNSVMQLCRRGIEQTQSSILYNWMARVQSLALDLYAANSTLKESLRYDPMNMEALANVAHFSFYSDKIEQSLKCFERIRQLASDQIGPMSGHSDGLIRGESSELLNNLALCNFFSGFYHRVMPLFNEALMNSPSKEVTSDIWYNISFVPLNCGFRRLAIACLNLALKNNSQNDEALNNLGVLEFDTVINDKLYYENINELGSVISRLSKITGGETESDEQVDGALRNLSEAQSKELSKLYRKAETYFNFQLSSLPEQETQLSSVSELEDRLQPEMLFNMALVKRKQGQLQEAEAYCNSYLKYDENNCHVREILKEIADIVYNA